MRNNGIAQFNEKLLLDNIQRYMNYDIIGKIENAINECIENFKFNEVAKIFELMNYKYSSYSVNGRYEHIPDADELKCLCCDLLHGAFAEMIVYGRDTYSIETGRIRAEASKEKINDNVEFMAKLYFVPIEGASYNCY